MSDSPDLDLFPTLKALSDRLPPDVLNAILMDFQRTHLLMSEIDAERRNFKQRYEKVRLERDGLQTALIGLLNLGGEEELESFLHQMLELVARLLGAEVGALSLSLNRGEETPSAVLITRHCTDADLSFIQEELAHVRGVLRLARERGQPVLLPVGTDQARIRDNLRQRHVKAAIAVPFAFEGGTSARGVIYLEHMYRADAFTGDLKFLYESLKFMGGWLARTERTSMRRRLTDHTVQYRRDGRYRQIAGRSAALAELLAQLELFRTTSSEATVLIEGEQGVGRETFALALHQASARAAGPFLGIRCAELDEAQLEQALFGDEHAVAYGMPAENARGVLERARGGSVYLEDVDQFPSGTQHRLMKALQERRFVRNHGEVMVKLDVRILCSSRVSLEEEAHQGRFDADLAERLMLFRLRVPPLRERREDILPLAEHFLAEAAAAVNKPGLTFTAAALQELERRPWLGNLSELSEIIHAGAGVCGGRLVDALHLRESGAAPVHGATAPQSVKSWKIEQDEFQRRLIRVAMELSNRNVTQAAKRLNISRQYLNNRLRTLGMADLRASAAAVDGEDDEDDVDGMEEEAY